MVFIHGSGGGKWGGGVLNHTFKFERKKIDLNFLSPKISSIFTKTPMDSPKIDID